MTGKRIAGIIVLVAGLALMVAGIQAVNRGDGFQNFVVPVVIVAIGIYLIASRQKTKEEKQLKRAGRQQQQQAKQEERAVAEVSLPYVLHGAGLPLPEGAPCAVRFLPEHILVESSGNSFTLRYEKVTDAVVKTDVEIQKSYVSSAGGAVAGGVLFGALGALIGGRAKEKKSKTVTKYLIVTYNKDGAVEYIGFELPAGTEIQAARLAMQAKSRISGAGVTVEL